MIYTVGLTGGIGSGKSAVAEHFLALGASVIDTDLISRALTAFGQPALALIRDRLGADYFQSDGSLNRAKLRERVFSSPVVRRTLEAILHPLIRQEALQQLARSSGPYALLVVPLLIEGGAYMGLLKRVLVVDCPEEIQIARTMARSKLTADEVRAIMSAQAGRSERLSAADDVINNSGDRFAMERQIEALHSLYQGLAGKG